MSDSLSPRSAFLTGAKKVAPILFGILPFGMVFGVAAVSKGIPPLSALAMSVMVFAGAAQLAVVELIGENAIPLVIVLTGIVVNLRYLMYSAGIAPHLKNLPFKWKAICAYILTDQAFLFSVTHFSQNKKYKYKLWFYLGAAVAIWFAFQAGTAAGIFLGSQIPDSWSLGFAVPLTLLSLLVYAVKDRATIAAAVAAGLTAVLAAPLPFNLGLIIAACVGIAVGLLVEEIKGGKHNVNDN